MNIKVYKTQEIDNSLWDKIIEGFNASFEGHKTTKDNLILGATSNHLGYSYHAISLENEVVIGYNTIIPYYYIHKSKERLLLGLSGSTYILRQYRNIVRIFYDMIFVLHKCCEKDGMIAFIAVPNSNSYLYFKKFIGFKDVFYLSYYILPINVFTVLGKSNLSLFDIFSRVYSIAVLFFCRLVSLFYNSKEHDSNYKLDLDDRFLYKRFQSPRYKSIIKGNKRFSYVLVDENGVKTAYLMDFRESLMKNYRILSKAVWYICMNERIDILVFVGTMNFKQFLLTKVPQKFEPKKLPFIYYFLNESSSTKFSDMQYSNSWDISLMNLDVR